jgi:RNA polymerase sigma-70 factor, ECF subfamily
MGVRKTMKRMAPEDAAAGLTDAVAVGRVRRGEREVYRTLVERYQDTLYRYAVSMVGDPDTAADMVQASFVNAYAKLGKLRDDASFGGWVYRMCVNRCRDHLKSVRRRDVGLSETPAHVLASAARTDYPLEHRELRGQLDDALAQLNDDLRTAFVMKHVEECSYDEMADVLGASVPALKMRVHRAREALRSALEEVL